MLGDVHRVVPKALELGGDLVVLVQDGHVVGELQLRQAPHHVFADLVGHAVDLVLVCLDLHVQLGIVFLQQAEGALDVAPGGGQNGQKHFVAALQS